MNRKAKGQQLLV